MSMFTEIMNHDICTCVQIDVFATQAMEARLHQVQSQKCRRPEAPTQETDVHLPKLIWSTPYLCKHT